MTPATLPSRSLLSHLFPTTPEGTSAGAELATTDGRSLPLVAVRLAVEARGGIARLVLEQRFENPYAESLNVTYRMPLPADGAVSGYAFEIAGRVIIGVVDRKRQARERFEQALAEGKTAALLEQERSDIFTQQLGNIPANAALVAKITVDQRLAWLPEGEWELRFPTVIGPRYIGVHDSETDVRATHVKVADKPMGVRVAIGVAIGDAMTGGPSSPSHAIARRGEALELTSQLDRDIVVRWPVATPAIGCTLASARVARGAFGLLTVVPPTKAIAAPRDLIVLIDTSGSMGGGPLDKAKAVVALMIESLGEGDRLELIEFSSSPRRYLREPVAITDAAKRAAIKWVRALQASGGTEIREATLEAMKSLRPGAQRQVVVVTDGYVGGEQAILKALHARLPASCRLHVLGVGSSVNRSLAAALARAGRGAEVIVGLDEDPERGAKRLLDRTCQPVLINVEIAGSALVQHAPEHIPDVFEGAPLVAALALRPEGGELVVRGELARERWEQRIRVAPITAGNAAIAALYGRERVADLESRAAIDQVDDQIEQLGMDFQIATRLTSWLAIDEMSRVTAATLDENIPQELPYGTSMASFGLRAGTSGVQTAGGTRFAKMATPMQMPMAVNSVMRSAPPTSAGHAPGGGPAGLERKKAESTGSFDKQDETTGSARPKPSAQIRMPVDKPAPMQSPTRPRKGPIPAWFAVVGLAILIALLIWWFLR